MTEYILLFIGAVFVHNVILARFLGNCPFLGVSKKIETAIGMGVAVTFVITLASIMTYLSYNIILVNLNLKYLYNIVFILVIASLVQLVEMIIQKTSPALYQALGVYLPLITTNCAVLGVAVINMKEEYNLIKATINGFGTAVGFLVAIVLLAGIREKMEYNDIPKPFKGYPIVLVRAGLMAIAFFGFTGLIK